nr:MAG TPA: hypothetical protein [Caudoviricetes sp.]
MRKKVKRESYNIYIIYLCIQKPINKQLCQIATKISRAGVTRK